MSEFKAYTPQIPTSSYDPLGYLPTPLSTYGTSPSDNFNQQTWIQKTNYDSPQTQVSNNFAQNYESPPQIPKKRDPTPPQRDNVNKSRLNGLLRERKVYHQAYDICPIKERSRFGVTTKSCPRVKDESIQTDPVLTNFGFGFPFDRRIADHTRRSSSLNSRNTTQKAQENSEQMFNLGEIQTTESRFVSYAPNSGYRQAWKDKDSSGLDEQSSTVIDDGYYHNNNQHGNLVRDPGTMTRPSEDFYPDNKPSISRIVYDESEKNLDKDGVSSRNTWSIIEHQNSFPVLADPQFSKLEQQRDNDRRKELKVDTNRRIGMQNHGGQVNPKIQILGDPNGKLTGDVSVIYKDRELDKQQMYSNNDIIDIKKLITVDAMQALYVNPDLIIIEGDLVKYKPGINFSYVKRWVQVTKNEIRYYKNHASALSWDPKPLLVVPFSNINSVYRVNIKLPKQMKLESTSKGVMKNEPKLYHFEIFTHDHPIPFIEELDASVHTDTSFIDKSSAFSSKYLSKEDDQGRSLLSIAKDLIDTRKDDKSHLMPVPSILKKKEERLHKQIAAQNNSYEDQEEKILKGSLINPKSGAVNSNTILPSNGANNGHGFNSTFITNGSGGLSKRHLDNQSLISEDKNKQLNPGGINKTMYHYVKNIEDLASWSGREKEWYYSEKRLLFSSVSNKEREIWLSIINWLINMSKNPQS